MLVNVKLVGCWEKGVFKTIFTARKINKICTDEVKSIFSLRQFLQIAQDFFSCYWFFFFPSRFHHKKWKLRGCMRCVWSIFIFFTKFHALLLSQFAFFPPFILFSFFSFFLPFYFSIIFTPSLNFYILFPSNIYVKETAFANSIQHSVEFFLPSFIISSRGFENVGFSENFVWKLLWCLKQQKTIKS